MLGAIIGDIIGSRHESSPKYPKKPVQNRNFRLFTPECRFTDDTVLTCATMDALLNHPTNPWASSPEYHLKYKEYGLKYPDRGYGSSFKKWLNYTTYTINNSYGNGCMMRCSPIAWCYDELGDCLYRAKQSIAYTHNSPESLRGVQSIVSAIFMAIHNSSKEAIRIYVEEQFGHMLNITVDQARKIPKTSIRCNVTAPMALVAFMESTDYESAVRNAVYIGGDTDTNAAIAGSIAEAYYKEIPNNIIDKALKFLPIEFKELIIKYYEEIRKRKIHS